MWDSEEPPPADPGMSFLLFADFKEAERNAELMLENGSDTFGGGMLKEGISQKEAAPEVTRLEFSLPADRIWGEGRPLGLGLSDFVVCLC